MAHTIAVPRWWRSENGASTVAFVILFPAFIMVLVSAVELGILTMRHTMLERGLDMAVRDIRLATGTLPESHARLKQRICDYAIYLPDCTEDLMLEMTPLDLRNYTGPDAANRCSDASHRGSANELVLLRACYRFTVLFPGSALGYALEEGSTGRSRMYASTAFVQEPG